VSSQAKIAANRANGRKGRGPRTMAGKSKASRNALRHGLAAISRNNPEFSPEIEAVASAICNGATDPLLFEQALIIAENGFVLRCVRAERIAAIERHRDATATPLATGDLGFARAKATLARAKLTYEMLVKRQAQDSPSKSAATSGHAHVKSGQQSKPAARRHAAGLPALQRDEFDAMRSAMPDLNRLERYRRRAWSRERRAVRRFLELQRRCGADAPAL
jgi:hypothetical protein